MRKWMTLKQILLLLTLVVALVAVPVVAAQNGAGEDPTVAQEGGEAGEAAAQEGGAGEGAEGEGEAVTIDEGADPLASLGINAGFLLAQTINFLIIFLLLRQLLWKPIINMIDARTQKIQKGVEDASAAANARRNAEAEAEQIRAEARSEAQREIESARTRGEELARNIEAEARTEAENIRSDARARANEERDRQLADLRAQVIRISAAVSQRLIGEALDEGRQHALVSDFFSRVPDAARGLTGRVEVVSAMPLNDDEQNRVRGEVGNQDINFRVDPEILGGLIIRTEDRVVDGSIRSGLTNLTSNLR
ncbi:MAG: F0F1 ATP synthase subunit B [Chloroflexi bacterium]|nr:F0F1 ATP synthase subunit B [Chloroflexota bacterium]